MPRDDLLPPVVIKPGVDYNELIRKNAQKYAKEKGDRFVPDETFSLPDDLSRYYATTDIEDYQPDDLRQAQQLETTPYTASPLSSSARDEINNAEAELDYWRKNVYPLQNTGVAITGVNGEQLPGGAEAWDWYGRPWYGGGVAGILKKMYYNIIAPIVPEKASPEYIYTPQSKITYHLRSQYTRDFLHDWEQMKEGTYGAPLAYLSRALSQTLGGGLEIISLPAHEVKRSLGVAYEYLSVLNQSRRGIPVGDVRERTRRAYFASKLLFTGLVDKTVKDEYLRRYDAGENPYLLALELENPLAESIGEFFTDPTLILSAIGSSLFKGARLLKASRALTEVAPEVKAVLAAKDVIDDAEALNRITEAAEAVSKGVKLITGGADDLVIRATPAFYTMDSKRFYVGRMIGDLGKVILHNLSIDDAADALKAMYMITSNNMDEVAHGIMIAKESPAARLILSRRGQMTGVVLRKLLGDTPDNIAAFTARVRDAGSLDEMILTVGGAIDTSLMEMFPDTKSLIEAARTYAEKGDDAGELTIKLAKLYNEKPWLWRALAKFERSSRSYIYDPTNTFFTTIYMGLNPAYAFRNNITNIFHIFVDEGVKAFRYNPEQWAERTSKWLGGATPTGIMGFSKGTMGVETLETPADALNYFRKISEKFEANGARAVVGKTVEDVMRKALNWGRALGDKDDLLKAGFSDAELHIIRREVINNFGDLGNAIDNIAKNLKQGRIDKFRNLSFLSDDAVKQLQDFGVYDDIVRVLADTPDDALPYALDSIDEIKNDLMAEMGRLIDEAPMVDAEGDAADTVLVSLGEVSDGFNGVATNAIQAHNQAVESANMAATNTLMGKAKEALVKQDKKLAVVLDELKNKLNGVWDESKKLSAEAESWANKWHEWKESIDASHGVKGRTPAGAWRQLAESGFAGDTFNPEPPGDWASFNQRFWVEFFYPNSHELYKKPRELYRTLLDEISETLGSNKLLQKAKVDMRLADDWDNLIVNYQKTRFAVQDALRRKDNYQAVVSTFEGAGTQTILESGAKRDGHIVYVINKYLGKNYSIDDLKNGKITVAEARKAIYRRARAKAAGEVLAEAEDIGVDYDWLDPDTLDKAITEVSNQIKRLTKAGKEDDLELVRLNAELKKLKTWRNTGSPGVNVKKVVIKKGKNETITARLHPIQDEIPGGIIKLEDGTAQPIKDIVAYIDNNGNTIGIKASPKGKGEKMYRGDFSALVATEYPSGGVYIPFPPANSATPSMARVLYEQRHGIDDLFDLVKSGLNDNWGRYIMTPALENKLNALEKWSKTAASRILESRAIAADVANEARKFTMLLYPEKTYFDLALSYIYPYHFWYSRTYLNWMRRMVTNPYVVASYARYRGALEKLHAHLPEWWKYNINTNELLGLDSENPLYFNLEATLNPLNGVLGVDFNDPYRRVDALTSMVDDLGKFGPSVWTPYSLAIALSLHLKGEYDAASRWGGRLFPQSAALKSALNLLNINIPTGQGMNEFDPAVLFFSGGMDSYERARVGRALISMVRDGEITEEEAMDAARAQEGDIWERAIVRAQRLRAPGQLSSFLFGVGFKGRTQSDIEIDSMYRDMRKLFTLADGGFITPDELTQLLREFRQKYPFSETVTLARKGGPERDRLYAYNVLSRLPPGQKSDILKIVGLDDELVGRFYDNKGDISDWHKSDRERFMHAIVDLAALFEIPDDAIQDEWFEASDRYKALRKEMEGLFGDDITDKIDTYYSLIGEGADRDRANVYLSRHPEVGEALDWKSEQVMNDDLLLKYYGGVSHIEKYYRGVMYDAIEEKLGKDIWQKWEEYSLIFDAKERAAYYRQHPELAEYQRLKDEFEKNITDVIYHLGKLLKKPSYAEFRYQPEYSAAQRDVIEYMKPRKTPYEYDYEDWQELMSAPLENLVLDYIYNGEKLPRAALSQLEDIAEKLNINADIMIQLISNTLASQ